MGAQQSLQQCEQIVQRQFGELRTMMQYFFQNMPK